MINPDPVEPINILNGEIVIKKNNDFVLKFKSKIFL